MLDKIGYLILLFLYTVGFSIGKSFFNQSDMPAKFEAHDMNPHTLIDKASYRLMDAIGMDDFFRELTDGL